MFQILTEDKNRSSLLKIFAKHLKGYTLLFGDGMWRGKVEPCITVQFTGASREVAEKIAAEVKALNSQESVLLIEHTAKVSSVN